MKKKSLKIGLFPKARLSLKTKILAAGFILSIIVLVKIMFIHFLLKPETAFAEPCSGTYTLDWGDPSTYTVTCGSVNAANWSVKGQTCFYYSPVLNVGGAAGGPNGMVDISVRINQSGNLDNNDTAWVYFYNDGIITHTDRFNGGGSPAVFTSTVTLTVKAGGTYQVSIELMNDKSNELWQIKNGDVTACVRGISPLPVKLINFGLRNNNDNTVLLNWTTASETQNDYFTIERSKDGNNFSEIKRIKGAGYSNEIIQYQFTDELPLIGKSYYRLKQTDFNGISETFNTLSILINKPGTTIKNTNVFPNPFDQKFQVSFYAEENAEVETEITDATGSKVYSANFLINKGNNCYTFIEGNKLSDGIFILRFIRKGDVLFTSKIFHKSY